MTIDKVLKVVQIVCMPIGTAVGVYKAFFEKAKVVESGLKEMIRGEPLGWGAEFVLPPADPWYLILVRWMLVALAIFLAVAVIRVKAKRNSR